MAEKITTKQTNLNLLDLKDLQNLSLNKKNKQKQEEKKNLVLSDNNNIDILKDQNFRNCFSINQRIK